MKKIVLAALLLFPFAAFAQTTFLGVKLTPQGNFGIGTTAPAAPLHVIGNSIITGTISGNGYNTKFGSAALINGYAFSGATANFVLQYDDIDYPPGNPDGIQIVNVNTNTFKTFIIDHPADPSRYLVHATLEGPEGAVYYRGTARLTNGRATVELPSYFEALTEKDGRTITLTNVDGFDRLAVRKVGGEKIRSGRFVVESLEPSSSQEFDWEVKAVRADGPPLHVEPLRTELAVRGFGPYTYSLANGQ